MILTRLLSVFTSPSISKKQFERIVLTAVSELDDAYGVSILKKVEQSFPSVRFGELYTALDFMEEKGYLFSWMADGGPKRGGRQKKCYRLEKDGEDLLLELAEDRAAMMGTIEERSWS